MALRFLIVLVVLAALGGGAYYLMRPYFEPPAPPPFSGPRVTPVPPKPAGPQFPIEAPAKPLPKLHESDPAVRESLSELFDAKALQRFFNVDDFIFRIVATIDNLPREEYAQRLNPLKATGGRFATSGKEDDLVIGPRNALRYEPAVRLLEATDTNRLVDVYRQYYPLFQGAYVELGYPNGYFNDRLVEVIDHLLDAPEPKGPVKLVQPKVVYEFADEDLQSLSSGRKIMVRMGLENEARVKKKLREIREKLVEQGKLGRQ